MTMTMTTLMTWTCLMVAQSAPLQQPWLKNFEGTWVVDGGRGSDVGLLVTIVRDKDTLVLTATGAGVEVVTRYDLSGADMTNNNVTGTSIFRTRIVDQKLVTEIWMKEAVGPPVTIETRYFDATGLMVTELTKTLGGTPFNRTALRRKSP
jgi:hypothetical protein